MTPKADIAVVGLAVMGRNLVLNMSDHGYRVVAFNRTQARVDEFLAGEARGRSIVGASTLPAMAALLGRPRGGVLVVEGGAPRGEVFAPLLGGVGAAGDESIAQLLDVLEPGDIIIDGGNSLFEDTARRTRQVEHHGLLYVGTGVSGGELGARHGPSLMPGGSAAAWPHVKPLLQAIGAKVDGGTPSCDWGGSGGAGH